MTAKIQFISAGAGSGKTYRLTGILHRCLVDRTARPAGVIATTFTRKAAAELRERVRSDLMAQGAHALANAMGQARIGTVNSVCGELLERFAFEAGLPPDQQVLDERQAQELLNDAIEVVLDPGRLQDCIDVAGRLEYADGWKGDLTQLVSRARANDISAATLAGFGNDNADALLAHYPKPAKVDLDAAMAKAIAAALPKLKTLAASAGTKVARGYVDRVEAFRHRLQTGRSTWADWAALAKADSGAGLKAVAEPIGALAARHTQHPNFHRDLRRYLQRMFESAAAVLEHYAQRKRELGVVDFVDQEHLLLRILDHPTVAETMRDELDLLLVDEFQDTSPIQLALFLKLSAFTRATYWVGDVKQAIYGFRDCDTALIKSVLAALPKLGGATEILDTSWRSRPSLVRLVNAVFVPAFHGTLAANEIELTPKRAELKTGAAFSNWVLGGKNKTEEASALAAGLLRLVASGYEILDKDTKALRAARYRDIVLLARTNDDVKALAGTLAASGVPTTTAQPGLLAQPELALALACLRRLNDRGDTVATAEIVSLADGAKPETWLAKRLRYVASGAPPNAWLEQGDKTHPLVARIAGMRPQCAVLTPSEAVRLIFTQCGLARRVLQWSPSELDGRQRLANLDSLLGLAGQYEDECRNLRQAATLGGFLLWLNQLQDQELDTISAPGVDAVQVLTHYGAKGLEWPIVILCGLEKAQWTQLWSISTRSRRPFTAAKPLADRFIRYWPWPYGAQQKIAVTDEIAASPEGKRFAASAVEEGKRLLYVSMTRARDLLILARSSRQPDGAWIASLAAPWMLPQGEPRKLTFGPKGDRHEVPYLRWDLDPAADASVGVVAQHLSYFDSPLATPTARLPLLARPSAAAAATCNVGVVEFVGTRIPLPTGVDMNAVGVALHACIAAAMVDPTRALPVAAVESILSGFGLAGTVSPEAVQVQIAALQAWLEAKWPGARIRVEVPIETTLDNGQVLRGQIDLLVETDNGWIVVDHKANPAASSAWPSIAAEHAGQLAAYAAAVVRTNAKPVAERWLFFPVAAGAIPYANGAFA